MDREPEEIPTAHYDVIVIGAGPSGCEAALAAARSGASTLCLTINLDMVGYPTATPVLVDNTDDRRHPMLDELDELGAQLPKLISASGVVATNDDKGGILMDRRRLGLAWKEIVETQERLLLRQALVTHIKPCPAGWNFTTRLGENFTASSVVLAAGTFLNGRVLDAGKTVPGGRWAEIPANSLTKSLQSLGLELVETWARTSPRLAARGVEATWSDDSRQTARDIEVFGDSRLRRDGAQLGEMLAYGLETEGSRYHQLEALRKNDGLSNAWITRGSYTVLHLVLAAEQVDETLEAKEHPGFFFAGRAAGSCNYTEAAALGLIAGFNAAVHAGFGTGHNLTKDTIFVNELLKRIAHKRIRPVTIRIDDETGC